MDVEDFKGKSNSRKLINLPIQSTIPVYLNHLTLLVLPHETNMREADSSNLYLNLINLKSLVKNLKKNAYKSIMHRQYFKRNDLCIFF